MQRPTVDSLPKNCRELLQDVNRILRNAAFSWAGQLKSRSSTTTFSYAATPFYQRSDKFSNKIKQTG